MTDAEQREAARQFVNRWMGKGKEDEDGRSYWIDLLTNVLGMDNVTERLNFEKKVVIDGNTKRIDVYIPETRVIIEQKSLGKALDQKIRNSGDVDLTPFEQADRYNGKLTFDERARWIVTSNFAEIWIYDMNQKQPEPTKIALDELQSKYPLLDFLVKKEVKTISHEMEVSIKAGGIAMVKEIVAEEFESEVLGADVPVLVDFWAEWCSPCRMMGPVFKELSTEIGSQMKFFKLNVETERQVADYYGVMSIPTLILFKNGEEVLRLTGLRKKEAMLEELKPYLS